MQLRLAELVVPVGELDATVGDLVAAILALDPGTARATKELLAQAPGHTLEQQAAAERRVQAALQRGRPRAGDAADGRVDGHVTVRGPHQPSLGGEQLQV